ncbi:MAG: hypothetical protein WBD22_12440 [Pyrinomonadaceae bacterium]
MSGLVKTIANSSGGKTERIWGFNRPTGANTTANINAYVKTEFTTIADGSGNPTLTAIKDITVDANGNQIEIKEYDWVAYSLISRNASGEPTGIPAAAPLKRITSIEYYNAVSENSSNAYWLLSSPNVRNAVEASEVRDANGTPFTRVEMFYDDPAATANLIEIRVWASTKGPRFRRTR